MGSDLEAYAAHCRKMAAAVHRPDCTGRAAGPALKLTPADGLRAAADLLLLPDDGCFYVVPRCPGCVTPRDRSQWEALAEEALAHLARTAEPTLL